MKVYQADKIRNVALIGHGGEGKTTLTEAMLSLSGTTDRMGKTDDGTTITDYDPEEIQRHISISTALAPFEWKDHKINLLDTPGYFDFEGEVIEAMTVADSALIVLGATSGVTVGAEKAWKLCRDRKMPRGFVVNRMDADNADFKKVFGELEEIIGRAATPIQWPIIEDRNFIGYVDLIEMKGYHFGKEKNTECPIPDSVAERVEQFRSKLVETAAESNEEMLDKFFAGEELSQDEILGAVKQGVMDGELAPVFCTAANGRDGIMTIMDNLIQLMPSPKEAPAKIAKNSKGEKVECVCDDSAPFAAQVFKTVTDNFVGKMSLFKVYSGKVKSGDSVYCSGSEKTERISGVFTMRGKKTYPVEQGLSAGDIGVFTKLQNVSTGDTLRDSNFDLVFDPIVFPETVFAMAISAKKEGEEDKVFGGIQKLLEEDPTFKLEKSAESNDMLLKGMGEMHLDVIISKVKRKFNVEGKLEEPTVPYRETIRKNAKAQGRHKKQSGGSGQFGDVWVEFEPIFDENAEFEFVDKVVGGAVPRNFIPAVEKGLKEAMQKGVLAGYPTIRVRATLYDGSSHAVDSNEMAFRQAARLAYKKGIAEANPVLLEPIYHYEIYVPDDYMGDIIGDLNRRRGRILGMNPAEDGEQQIVAEVPYSEMFKYATDLRSMTQGRGKFTAAFERFEEAPANIAQKVVEKAQKDADED